MAGLAFVGWPSLTSAWQLAAVGENLQKISEAVAGGQLWRNLSRRPGCGLASASLWPQAASP